MLAVNSQNSRVVVSEEDIQKAVKKCADAVTSHLKDKNGATLMVCVLKGAIFFFCDVLRHFTQQDYEIDFCKLTSYDGDHSSGRVKMLMPCHTPLAGKHVVLFEDIIDTGLTLDFLKQYFAKNHVASLMTCALLDKPDMRKVNIRPDFVGLEVPNAFLVGYGLDYNQQFRLLNHVRALSGS